MALVRPSYDDVMQQVEQLGESKHNSVEVLSIGTSVQGRNIPCVRLTDPSVAHDDKQHVLIVASQHGAEESGRAIAMALMDFLVSGEAQATEILRQQIVAVVPCGNPDGAVADSNRNADGMDIAHTYAYEGVAATPEGRTLEALAATFLPDVVVDIHGRAGGGMKELAWLMPAWAYSSDRYFLTAMAMAMADAGEAVGFPQCELTPAGSLTVRDGHVAMLGDVLTYRYKALCMGLETIEHYYSLNQWQTTGVSRLLRLLRFGMEDSFGLGEPGYPNVLVSGNRIQGLKAHGKTAAQRRANRVALTRFLSDNWAMASRNADGIDGCAKVTVVSKTYKGPNPERFAILLRFKKPCEIRSVTWRDQALQPDDEHGYRTWDDACSRFVQANIAEPFGGDERHLIVNYDSPCLQGRTAGAAG